MKNTQKKLKAKHFRYLSKEYVKDPDRFLKEVVHQWGLNWSNNFNYLINSSIYPPMRIDTAFEYGFMHHCLGQMIEVGFVILVKCNLKPMAKQNMFQYSCRKVVRDEIEKGIIFPEKTLCAFYGFKSVKEWLAVLNDLLRRRDYGENNMEELPLDLEYVPIREFLLKLPVVLHEIYQRGGLQLCLPAYAGGINRITRGNKS